MTNMVPIKKDTWYVCVKGIYNANGEKEVPMATMDGKKTPKSDFQQLAEDLMNLNPIEVELLRLTSENDMPPAGVCSMV